MEKEGCIKAIDSVLKMGSIDLDELYILRHNFGDYAGWDIYHSLNNSLRKIEEKQPNKMKDAEKLLTEGIAYCQTQKNHGGCQGGLHKIIKEKGKADTILEGLGFTLFDRCKYCPYTQKEW